MTKLNLHLVVVAAKYERETGHTFRHAFKTCGNELSCVVMPCDMGMNEEEDAKNS